MCKHKMVKAFDGVKFCPKCGLVVFPDSTFYIDKEIRERKRKREKHK